MVSQPVLPFFPSWPLLFRVSCLSPLVPQVQSQHVLSPAEGGLPSHSPQHAVQNAPSGKNLEHIQFGSSNHPLGTLRRRNHLCHDVLWASEQNSSAGCIVPCYDTLLQIRTFPSNEFYGGALCDAPDADQRTLRPWHQYKLFGPFFLFDLPKSREEQGSFLRNYCLG